MGATFVAPFLCEVDMTKKKKPEDREKVGRPTILTKDVVNKLEQAFSMGCSDLEACFYADISKQTLYNYQAKHPEFVDRKERLKERMIFKARTVIADALNKNDENTAKWYLERKKKDEFSTRSENLMGNIDETPFRIEMVE